MKIIDFPKIKSPFIRKDIDGHHVVTPEIEPGYEWVFEDQGVKAVDKLHGTNCCIIYKDGILQAVHNRKNIIQDKPYIGKSLSKTQSMFLSGILASAEKGWLQNCEGRVFGELIGPKMNGNLHGVERPYFVPFQLLRDRMHWNSWISNQYPKTFDSISDWFKGLPSLFTQKYGSGSERAEGIIFTHPDGRMAKLRRDMFRWYYDNLR